MKAFIERVEEKARSLDASNALVGIAEALFKIQGSKNEHCVTEACVDIAAYAQLIYMGVSK